MPAMRRWTVRFTVNGDEIERTRKAKLKATVRAWVLRRYPQAEDIEIEHYRRPQKPQPVGPRPPRKVPVWTTRKGR